MEEIKIKKDVDEFGNEFILITEKGEILDEINYEYCSIECQNDYNNLKKIILNTLRPDRFSQY